MTRSADLESSGVTAQSSAPAPAAASDSGSGSGDLGLSGVFEAEPRFLHRNGRFNSRRVGLGWGAYNPYTLLLSLTWPRFFAWSLAVYLLLNGLFALLYYALGPGALSEHPRQGIGRLAADFFFSVQTFGTIGFGHVYPATTAADLAVTLEAFVGLMAVALVTGMLFARFSRASHRLMFSDCAVIAPYRGGRALMFRVMNGRQSDLGDVSAEVVLTIRRAASDVARTGSLGHTGGTFSPRDFASLPLERSHVTLFPLAWTVVHPIDEQSPLYGLSAEDLLTREAEVIVIFRATDEISQQAIQTRTSYHTREILWGHKFQPMYLREGNLLAIDARLLHNTEPAEL